MNGKIEVIFIYRTIYFKVKKEELDNVRYMLTAVLAVLGVSGLVTLSLIIAAVVE